MVPRGEGGPLNLALIAPLRMQTTQPSPNPAAAKTAEQFVAGVRERVGKIVVG